MCPFVSFLNSCICVYFFKSVKVVKLKSREGIRKLDIEIIDKVSEKLISVNTVLLLYSKRIDIEKTN